MSKRVLITGATGFIGMNLTHELVDEGYEVVCLVKPEGETERIDDLDVKIKYGDIKDEKRMDKLCEGIDYVIHLAALARMYSFKSRREYIETNVMGTRNILEAAKENNIEKVIYMSSIDAVGPHEGIVDENTEPNPENVYGKTKYGGEVITNYYNQEYNLDTNVIRIPTVYGPGDIYFFERLIDIINKSWFPKLGEGKGGFCYVKNLVYGIKLVLDEGVPGETYFISDENNYTLEEIVLELSKQLDKDIRILDIPKPVSYIGALFIEGISKLIKRPPFVDKRTKMPAFSRATVEWNTKTLRAVDISKAKNELGYEPEYGLKDGVKATLDWYRERDIL